MELIYVKDVDKSLLFQGFTIKASLLNQFLESFGKLNIGESRKISIILNNQLYTDIQVINQNFNRHKYPDHPEMYQVRYNSSNSFSKAIRALFPEITLHVNQQLQINSKLKEQGIKTSNIKIPNNQHALLSFYSTTNDDVWEAVPIYASEFHEATKQIKEYEIDEPSYEGMLFKDDNAYIKQEMKLVKIRKLDRNVCLNLKKLYTYRCQICGELITAPYGGEENVIDAHHIAPFTTSLNNNYNNIMILCPNHHRIVHAYHPKFKVQSKSFIYPNGYKEGLKLNIHL